MDAAVQVPSLRPQDRRVSVCRAPKIPTASYVRYGGITWMQAAISGFAVMSVCGWLEILERKPTGLLVVAIGLLLQAVPVFGQPGEQLQLVQTIALPDVRGRIDHLDIDLDGSRLFVAALGNNSVEVIDLRSGRRSASREHLREPQGVAYVPREKSLFIASGGSGPRVANVPIGGDVR